MSLRYSLPVKSLSWPEIFSPLSFWKQQMQDLKGHSLSYIFRDSTFFIRVLRTLFISRNTQNLMRVMLTRITYPLHIRYKRRTNQIFSTFRKRKVRLPIALISIDTTKQRRWPNRLRLVNQRLVNCRWHFTLADNMILIIGKAIDNWVWLTRSRLDNAE